MTAYKPLFQHCQRKILSSLVATGTGMLVKQPQDTKVSMVEQAMENVMLMEREFSTLR